MALAHDCKNNYARCSQDQSSQLTSVSEEFSAGSFKSTWSNTTLAAVVFETEHVPLTLSPERSGFLAEKEAVTRSTQ